MAEKAVQAEQSIKKENKMGTMPVNKLLLSMALPMIVSMLVQALYNIVDSIFVAQLSENALTAVSMAFPIQNLMIGMATGIVVVLSFSKRMHSSQRLYQFPWHSQSKTL